TSPIQLAHVKMEIKDCQSTPNLSFESTSIMNFITLYNSSPFGGTNESHSSIDASDTENSALCQMVISGFSPTKVNGGTGDIVTISGSMFGSTKGTVQLRNTDVNGSPWVTLDSYDVTWTDTEIIIKVPSVVPLASPTPDKSVGTGKIKITNQSGTSKESSQVLEVYYSWNNSTLIGSEKFKIFLAGVDNVWDEDLRNQQLGYSFVLNPNIANNSNAYGCVIKAIKDWVCATEIRWQVDSNVSSLPSKRDTVSTIQFGTTGASHIQGETQVWNYNCGGPSSSTMSFATDVDIIISNRSTHPWMYDSTGQNQQNSGVYDFYSIILHELGHAHLMKHVNDPNDLMWSESKYHPTNNIPWTDRKTVFSWSNLDGGAQIVDESENADYTFCSIHEYPMIRLHKENCSVSMYNENDKKSNSSSLLVFPNPFTNQVTIEFNSISTLTCHIEIFSLNGQKHFKSTQNLVQDAKNKFLINTEFFPSGFYLGKVQLGEEQFNFKIVKP
ncbi:MAG: T9SS type A sorting domain-containing protein, partial [Flavobacteriales bacterium]|nr:T9SS type A sorting domain-containing protein [Flavobacteriales bacterium]